MTDQMASHKAVLEQQFAHELAEMRSMLQAALTSRDQELAIAKVATDKAKAERGRETYRMAIGTVMTSDECSGLELQSCKMESQVERGL